MQCILMKTPKEQQRLEKRKEQSGGTAYGTFSGDNELQKGSVENERYEKKNVVKKKPKGYN